MSDSEKKKWPLPIDLETPGSPRDNHRNHPRYQMISSMYVDYLDELYETGVDGGWDDWCDAHHKNYLEELVEAGRDGDEPRGRIRPWDWGSLGL